MRDVPKHYQLSLHSYTYLYPVARPLYNTAISAIFAPLLPVGVPGGAINQAAAFACAFVLSLLVWALGAKLLRLLIHATPLQWPDRLLGGGFDRETLRRKLADGSAREAFARWAVAPLRWS